MSINNANYKFPECKADVGGRKGPLTPPFFPDFLVFFSYPVRFIHCPGKGFSALSGKVLTREGVKKNIERGQVNTIVHDEIS